jgi:ceramide glucosyltransferase
LIVIVCAGIAYLLIATIACIRFAVRRLPPPNLQRGVTILKPVHGLEPQLEENLRSFCLQQHPNVQVLFGVQRANDPAIPVIERVIASVAGDCRLVVDETPRAGNPKMANVASLLPYARYDILAISDADMRVDSSYAGIIAAAFDDERTGAATCLYAGIPAHEDTASRLASMHINEVFAPSVLVATLFSPPRFCFGSTMAVRREVLGAIGGIEALGAHLADDYTLGRLVTEAGYRVALSRYVVANVVHEDRIESLFAHELRWARTIRMVQPAGYAFSFVTYPALFALLFAFVHAASPIAAAGVLALLLRLLMGVAARYAVGVPLAPRLALWPLHEAIELAVWACGLFGSSVRWQDRTLETRTSDLL